MALVSLVFGLAAMAIPLGIVTAISMRAVAPYRPMGPIETIALTVGPLAYVLVLPFSLSSVVLGHTSRAEIARSAGRLKGAAAAFTGMALSYLQLTWILLALIGLVGEWNRFQDQLNRRPDMRAELAWLVLGGRLERAPAPDEASRHRESAVAALQLIREDEHRYLLARPDTGYSCNLYVIEQAAPGTDTELINRVARSSYDIRIQWCTGGAAAGYAALAIPRSNENGRDAPLYCLDAVNGILKYGNGQANSVYESVLRTGGGECLLDGETVE